MSFILEQQILTLKSQGNVAEPNTWISSYTVTKKDSKKTYTYFRVMQGYKDEKGGKKARVVKYLGKEGSKSHREAQKAIALRNQIQKLERKMTQLKREKKTVRGTRSKAKVSHQTFDPQPIFIQLSQLQGEINQLRQENRELWEQIRLIC